MIWSDTAHFMLYSLILMRISGFILLNPLLGRRQIPIMTKAGFILVLTLLIYTFTEDTTDGLEVTSSIVYGFYLIKEFAVGYVVGFTMQLFYMVLSYAGTIMDFDMGLSMATVFDAQSNSQIALTGSILNMYYGLLFFAVDGHLALMRILVLSGDVVPYGQVGGFISTGMAVLDIFKECIVLAVQLAFPLLAVEFITAVGVGILMKMIPQINVFVINIQLKIIVGLVMLVFLFAPISNMLKNLITTMISQMGDILTFLSAG